MVANQVSALTFVPMLTDCLGEYERDDESVTVLTVWLPEFNISAETMITSDVPPVVRVTVVEAPVAFGNWHPMPAHEVLPEALMGKVVGEVIPDVANSPEPPSFPDVSASWKPKPAVRIRPVLLPFAYAATRKGDPLNATEAVANAAPVPVPRWHVSPVLVYPAIS